MGFGMETEHYWLFSLVDESGLRQTIRSTIRDKDRAIVQLQFQGFVPVPRYLRWVFRNIFAEKGEGHEYLNFLVDAKAETTINTLTIMLASIETMIGSEDLPKRLLRLKVAADVVGRLISAAEEHPEATWKREHWLPL